MKKLALFTLSMLMLASTLQPALAVLTDAQFKIAHKYAKKGGIRTGATIGILSGLGNGYILSGLSKNYIGAALNVFCFNFTSSGLFSDALIAPKRTTLEEDSYTYNGEVKIAPTTKQREQLLQTMENYRLGTDILVTAGVTSALASGAMSGLLGETSSTESNSIKNFCTVFPFALTIATVLKLGAWKCAIWTAKKYKATQASQTAQQR